MSGESTEPGSDERTTEPSGDEKPEPDEVVTTQSEPLDFNFIEFEVTYDHGDSLDGKGSPWDSTDNDGTLTISARAFENRDESDVHVSAGDVFIRGPSITTVGNGQWSEQPDPNPEKTDSDGIDGDSIVIEANADYELRIVYEKLGENGTVTISGWSGPDA